MTLNRANANLITYFIYHEKDAVYLTDLEARFNLLIEDNRFGSLRMQTLEVFNLRDKTTNSLLNRPSCLICMLSPNFIYAIRRDDYLWTELVAAHQNQAVLILPFFAEDCGDHPHPFSGIPTIQTPLRTMRLQSDHVQQLNELFTSFGQQIAGIITHFSLLEEYWKNTLERNNIVSYQAFSEKFKGCKYEAEAKKLQLELLEKELWESALAFDDTIHYLNYLKESPLKLQQDQAVERIIEIELKFELIEEEVKKNDDLGLLFDYKWRFRKQMNTAWVQDRIFTTLGDSVRLDGNHRWIEAESQLLKIEIYKTCFRQEIYTFSLLEEYVKSLHSVLRGVRKKLKVKRGNVGVLTVLTLFSGVIFLISLELIGANIFSALFTMVERHPFLFLVFVFLNTLAVRNMLKYLRKEEATCDVIIKAIAKEMIHLKVAFIIRANYGKCLKELHNMEEWAMEVAEKNLWSYAWAEEEKMEFKSHQLRPLKVTEQTTIDD